MLYTIIWFFNLNLYTFPLHGFHVVVLCFIQFPSLQLHAQKLLAFVGLVIIFETNLMHFVFLEKVRQGLLEACCQEIFQVKMNFSLVSSWTKPKCCASDCMQHTGAGFPLLRPPVSISSLIKKHKVQAIRTGAGRRAISSQLIPSHIQESYKRNKHLQVPVKKLDFVRTLMIDNYDSYTYNIYQALSVVNGGMSFISLSLHCVFVCV